MAQVPNPYAAPLVQAIPRGGGGTWLGAIRRAAVCFAFALGLGGAATAALMAVHSSAVGTVGFGGAALCASVGAWFAGTAIVRARVGAPPRTMGLIAGAGLLLVNGAMALFGALLALLSTSGGRGRQLRRLGRVLMPRLRSGDAWSHGAVPVLVDDAMRDKVAAQWRENARTEHASVAAFARLTLDLIALGAPPALIAAAQRDGMDETRHAQMCLELAAAIDGRHESPAPFPEARRARTLPRMRGLALAQLAVDSLVDGALHEGVSARIIARLARLAEVPQIRGTLARIAADEGRHAAHGWQVVQWCVREGGNTVVHALRGAVRVLPETRRARLPAGAADGSWERWGIHGQALEASEYAKARAHVVERVAALEGERGARARAA